MGGEQGDWGRSMARTRSRFFVAVAAFSMVGASVAGVGAAGATAGAATAPLATTAGAYQASFPAESSTSPLAITAGPEGANAGTFAFSTFGDYGTWIVANKVITMLVTASSSGHVGDVLIGKVTLIGIGPGAYSRLGIGASAWSATRSAKPQVVASGAVATPSVAAGVYAVQFPDVGLYDTLTVTNDTVSTKEGTFTFTILGDTGHWVTMGKRIALGITTGPDAGVTLSGALNATGISTALKPGLYDIQGSGVFHWYATH